MTLTRQPTLAVAVVVASWYGMMAVHEFGHVIHAWLSGGRVAAIEFPLAGFSQTNLSHNPHPLFVAWGGAIWESVVPLGVLGAATLWRSRLTRPVQFFCGFCLIANGAYLGTGPLTLAGDAGDILRSGSPPWLLVVFGVLAMSAGLFLWHRLGPRFGFMQAAREPRTGH